MTDAEKNLDPENWEDFRRLSHQALDAALDDLMAVRKSPVWRETPPEVLARLDDAAPENGVGLEQVLADFARDIQPYGVGNRHPAFFGWAHGAGTPVGMVAEMLSAGLNLNCGGRNHIGVALEQKIAAAMAQKFGFPETASGLFVTGASQANFHGVVIARRAALGAQVRTQGIHAPLRAYASQEAHACVEQAMDLAGLGTDALRKIPTDAEGRIRLDVLRQAIEADRAAGDKPFLLIASAGTVNFGAFDPLNELADIAAQEKLWLHVDGAFGALTIFSEKLKPKLAGIHRADSIAFDFHKWAHVPYDAGFILVRDIAAQRAAFASPAAYLSRTETGLAKGETWPCDLGPDLSRGFRALKVWMTLRAYGLQNPRREHGAQLRRRPKTRRTHRPVSRLRARGAGSAQHRLLPPEKRARRRQSRAGRTPANPRDRGPVADPPRRSHDHPLRHLQPPHRRGGCRCILC